MPPSSAASCSPGTWIRFLTRRRSAIVSERRIASRARRIVAVVRQVAGEEDQVGLRIERVDDVDGALERLRAEGIGRPLKSDVRVAELHDREGAGCFAVGLAKERRRRSSASGVNCSSAPAPSDIAEMRMKAAVDPSRYVPFAMWNWRRAFFIPSPVT